MSTRKLLWVPILILLITSGVWAQTVSLLDSSYIRQEARLLNRWGHTNSNQLNLLTFPGNESVSALQSQNNAEPGPDEQSGTTSFTGTDEETFTIEAQHSSEYFTYGGFLNSYGIVHIHLDEPRVYILSGSFTTETATGKLFVHIKDIETEKVFIENNQDGNNLDVSGGTPTGELRGFLPAGNYEFYVLMQSYRENIEQYPDTLTGSGSVTLTLFDDPVMLRPESYIKQLARIYYHWGHTNGNTVTPLTLPGNETLTVLQSRSGNAEPGTLQQTGTISYNAAETGILNFEAYHSSVYTQYGGFLESEGLLYFDLTTPMAYEINGSFITEMGSGMLNVYLKNITDGEEIVFLAEQAGSELDINQEQPDSGRIGLLMPGTYEFYVNMRSERAVYESIGVTKSSSGEVSLKLLPPADVSTVSIASPYSEKEVLSGQELGIEWTTTGQNEGCVVLSYSLDSNNSWIPIALTENTGSYYWTVPEICTKSATIRVQNALHPSVDDIVRYINIDTCTDDLPGDINKDCHVDLGDFSLLAAVWLDCTNPYDSSCE